MKYHQENGLFLAKGFAVLFVLFLASYCLRYAQGFSFNEIEPFSQKNIQIVVAGTTQNLPLQNIIEIQKIEKTEDISFVEGFLYWSGIKTNNQSPIKINEEALQKNIEAWEKELDFIPASEGSITIKNNTLHVESPQNGVAIDYDHIFKNIKRLAQKKDAKRNYTIYSRTVVEKPKTDIQSFEETVQILSFGLANDITLKNTTFQISHTLEKGELAMLLEIEHDPATHKYSVSINTNYLEEILSRYNREKRDASFEVKSDAEVDIIPSQNGITALTSETGEKLLANLSQEKNTSPLIFSEPINPEFTTQDAEELNIQHLVSSFTTYYSCCEARARNIQKFANFVNGAVVYPGEEFNLNTHVGKRTEEGGFEPAGTLIKGQLIETIGGGVSQFATTFFNAVYWGGFEDITHTPHSRYFSRYPEGIEATISWPKPDLVFKNDSDSGIWIKTSYTDTSITVSFFGNNDGRIVHGKHKDKQTIITVVDEGGSKSRVVTSEVGEPEILHEPKEIYFTNEHIPPFMIAPKSEGRPNYSVEVIRTISQNGEQIFQNKKTVRYLSEDKEFFVHSCEYAPQFSICKTPEDIEREKEELEEFFAQLEENL